MPYVVKTTRPDSAGLRVALRLNLPRVVLSDVAVATLDEARKIATRRMEEAFNFPVSIPRAMYDAYDAIKAWPEQGGKLSLPDGTDIEVVPT